MDRSTIAMKRQARRKMRHTHTHTHTNSSKDHNMYDTHPHSRHRSEHSRGGHGGHGRHRARRGALLAAVLTLLDERPMHGYELITELEDRSEGRWRPSPGAMYPALKKMVMHDLVTAEDVDGKRQFTLTDAGRERLAEVRQQRGDDAAEPWEQTGTGGRGELRGSVAELIGQARQIGRFGTAEQIEKARSVFDDAKRQLYAILAEAPTEENDSDSDATALESDAD
jgi:DNA-binding PadR family transcriptional regulator